MVAVGEQDLRDAEPRDLVEIGIAGQHRVDAEVAARFANEVSIEVIAVRFREPRPGEDAGKYFAHRFSSPRKAILAPRANEGTHCRRLQAEETWTASRHSSS